MIADLVNLSEMAWLVMLGCVAVLGLYAYVRTEGGDG